MVRISIQCGFKSFFPYCHDFVSTCTTVSMAGFWSSYCFTLHFIIYLRFSVVVTSLSTCVRVVFVVFCTGSLHYCKASKLKYWCTVSVFNAHACETEHITLIHTAS